MKNVYINSVGSVSAQKTFDNSEFLEEIVYYEANVIKVIDPNYKDYIPPAAARRMAKGIKMSTISSRTALDEAGLENVDAIMVGTGLGCIGDSAKFVSDIIDNNEQYLTPYPIYSIVAQHGFRSDCLGYRLYGLQFYLCKCIGFI